MLLASDGALAATGLAIAAGSPSIPVARVGFFLGGMGISVAAPTLFGATGRGASEAERGSAIASVTAVSYLGFLAGPPLMGAISGAGGLRFGVGTLAAVAVVLALATASLAGSALPLRRQQRPPRGQLS